MPANGESVKPSLREILADSHISAVAIAVLIVWSFDSLFHALWKPFLTVLNLLFTAMAIRGIPQSAHRFGFSLFLMFSYLAGSFIGIAAAWLLSLWVYDSGPLRSLNRFRAAIVGRNHA
jgi:hypothetical protein